MEFQLDAGNLVKIFCEVFPKAMIAARGNLISATMQFGPGMLATLIPENNRFALLLHFSNRVSLECYASGELRNIKLTFEFGESFTDPGITEIIAAGEIETAESHRKEMEKRKAEIDRQVDLSTREKYVVSTDFQPENEESLRREIDRMFEWFNKDYKGKNVVNIDRGKRWKKLRESAGNGGFPFDIEIDEPTPETFETCGLVTMRREFPSNMKWEMSLDQKREFEACFVYSDDLTISYAYNDGESDIEILFGVDVYGDDE